VRPSIGSTNDLRNLARSLAIVMRLMRAFRAESYAARAETRQ
jgi:hypothetical protein